MDSTTIKEGPMFKLPTWSKAPASLQEKQFKLRYFALIKEDSDARLFYYKNEKVFKSGGAPNGSIDINGSRFERINKLDFVLLNDRKRLWCRAFSENIANGWEEAFAGVGLGNVDADAATTGM